MSEIQRYMYARDGMVPDAEHLRGSGEPEFWVRFTDHEAERAENLATIDFLNKELRSAVDALADAEARIEGLVHKEQGFDNADMEYGYGRGLAESIRALAALTQPQTENREAFCEKHDVFHCDECGGGAATPRGVADANLEGDEPSETEAVARVKAVMKAGRDAGSGVFDSNSVFRFGTHGVAALLNFLERDGWEVIHTGVYAQPQKWIQAEAELEDQPGPYVKAFRERVCPVPEFPGIKNRQEDQA